MLRMMVELLSAAEQINSNVEHHSSEIQKNVQQVDDLPMTGEMEMIKQLVLGHMRNLLASNRRMQDDLLCTRYRLEEQAEQIDHVRREARQDELTGVANRKAFNEKLHLLMDQWRRQQTSFVLVLLDLDHFKRVNDSHGHLAGDRLLAAVGLRLKELVREEDFVGRFGGDEFAILLPHTELDVGIELAEAVRRGTADHAWRHFAARRGAGGFAERGRGRSTGRRQRRDAHPPARPRHDRAKQLGRNQIQWCEPRKNPRGNWSACKVRIYNCCRINRSPIRKSIRCHAKSVT